MKEKKSIDGILEFTREGIAVNYAQLSSLIVKDLNNSSSTRYSTFTRDDVTRFLGNPVRYHKDLQRMSNYLYDNSAHYRRIINYFARMATLDHYVEPYGLDVSKSINEKSFRNNYIKTTDLVELMSIKLEFGKAMLTAWKLGTFYGYELYTKESYFIMELPYEYCQISGISDGVFTFSFDLSYFERNADKLLTYPKEFVSMFNSFKNGSKPKWQEVDVSKSVCLKVNMDSYYDIPPFAGVFADIFDIEDYKELRKMETIMGNYKFIIEKIPLRKDSGKNNDFLVDLKTVNMFHNKTATLLPDEIGIFSTPFDIDTIEFKKDNSSVDDVANAERGFYSGIGTSQMLFNGTNSTQASLSKSINVDESEIFFILRQIEKIIDTKIKKEVKGSYKFRVKLLDTTIFNRKEKAEELLKNAQFGLPVKIMLCASLGLTPSATDSMAYLENTILNLTDKFIPLKSSHTSKNEEESSNGEGGKPQSDEGELSEKGEEQRAREDNENRDT